MRTLLALLATVSCATAAPEFWVTPDFYSSPTTVQGQIFDPRLAWPIGSIQNPYTVSDANRFDAVMNSIPTNSTIHLMAGNYQTAGGWMPRSGQHITGAGMWVTTVQFPASLVKSWSLQGGVRHMIQPFNQLGEGRITLEDFTLDANYQKGSFVTLCGAQLLGPDCSMRRIRLINCASYTTNVTNYAECFGLTISSRGTYDQSGNDNFDGCIVSDYTQNWNNNMTPMGFVFNAHGRVLNCELNNNLYDGTNSMLGIGIAADNTQVYGNTLRWNRDALHFDTGNGWTNVAVFGNNFLYCGWMQDYHNAHFAGINYIGNSIILTNFFPKQPYIAVINMQGESSISGMHMSGNRIQFAASTKQVPTYFLVMQNVTGFQSDGDFIDAGLSNQIISSSGVTIQSKDLNGQPYPYNQ